MTCPIIYFFLFFFFFWHSCCHRHTASHIKLPLLCCGGRKSDQQWMMSMSNISVMQVHVTSMHAFTFIYADTQSNVVRRCSQLHFYVYACKQRKNFKCIALHDWDYMVTILIKDEAHACMHAVRHVCRNCDYDLLLARIAQSAFSPSSHIECNRNCTFSRKSRCSHSVIHPHVYFCACMPASLHMFKLVIPNQFHFMENFQVHYIVTT